MFEQTSAVGTTSMLSYVLPSLPQEFIQHHSRGHRDIE
jgi:hypothetical protein